MNVGSVGSTVSPNVQAVQQQAASAQTQRTGRDNDGDSDKGAEAVQAPVPTVNLGGQKLGQIVNVTA
jgi:hypothetical protein